MIFRTPEQKNDLYASWNRPDRPFFAAGACHILIQAFLERPESAGFQPFMIVPAEGFRGGHLFAASPTQVFDYHGFSDRKAYLRHFNRKIRRFFPAWQGELIPIAEPLMTEFYARHNLRAPHQFHRDPLPRACAFVDKLLRSTSRVPCPNPPP